MSDYVIGSKPSAAAPPVEAAGADVMVAARLDRLPMTGYQRMIFAIVATAWFFDSIDLGSLTFLLGSIKTEFNLSTAQAGLLSSMSFLGMFAGAAIAGMLADKLGRRSVFQISMIFWGAGSLWCAYAPDATTLGYARAAARLRHGHGVPGRARDRLGVRAGAEARPLPRGARGLLAARLYRGGPAQLVLPQSLLLARDVPGAGVSRAVPVRGPLLRAGKPALARRPGPRRGGREDHTDIEAQVLRACRPAPSCPSRNRSRPSPSASGGSPSWSSGRRVTPAARS